MDLPRGQTEVWLAPQAGGYLLKLDFMDNANTGKTLTSAVTASVTVD